MKLTWNEMNWLVIAAGITVAYGIAVALILGVAKIWSFLTTTSELNAVGDFLAGVFAPIALIWLVAAVLTQRQELNETRDQFEDNQKVVDAQLKTINSQNELLTLQHQQSVENAAKAYRLSLFDKRFQIYERFVLIGETHGSKNYVNSYLPMVNLAQEAAFVFDKEMEDWLNDIAAQIYEYNQFREENPLLRHDDGFGNITVPKSDEHNEKLQKEYQAYSGWIGDQFLPEVRQSKFWHFMNVSDQAE